MSEKHVLLETADLLTRARAGDRGARSDLFHRYQQPLQRFLHARLPASARGVRETMDLVQEVSTHALASLDRFENRGVGSFWAFLRRIGLRYLGEVSQRAE